MKVGGRMTAIRFKVDGPQRNFYSHKEGNLSSKDYRLNLWFPVQDLVKDRPRLFNNPSSFGLSDRLVENQ